MQHERRGFKRQQSLSGCWQRGWGRCDTEDERAIVVGSCSWGQEPPSVAVDAPQVDMIGQVAVALALRDALHSRGIRSHEDLAEWIHAKGFPMPQWGAHFSGKAQERILNQAIAVDAKVSGLESLFVRLTLAECQRRRDSHPQREQQELQEPVQTSRKTSSTGQVSCRENAGQKRRDSRMEVVLSPADVALPQAKWGSQSAQTRVMPSTPFFC